MDQVIWIRPIVNFGVTQRKGVTQQSVCLSFDSDCFVFACNTSLTFDLIDDSRVDEVHRTKLKSAQSVFLITVHVLSFSSFFNFFDQYEIMWTDLPPKRCQANILLHVYIRSQSKHRNFSSNVAVSVTQFLALRISDVTMTMYAGRCTRLPTRTVGDET